MPIPEEKQKLAQEQEMQKIAAKNGKPDDEDGDVTVDDQKPAAVGAGRANWARFAESLEQALDAPRDELVVSRTAGLVRKPLGRIAKERGWVGTSY